MYKPEHVLHGLPAQQQKSRSILRKRSKKPCRQDKPRNSPWLCVSAVTVLFAPGVDFQALGMAGIGLGFREIVL